MLARVLRPQREIAFTMLRVVAGLMFSFHGMQKLFGVLGALRPAVGTQAWFGGIFELACGLAIAVGAATAWAAFLASGEMAVAYVQFHWKLDFGRNFFPTLNKGELALLYSFLFLYIACRGPGPASIDRTRSPAAVDPGGAGSSS